MPYFAHALIELEDGSRIQRGDTVPDELPGLEDLLESGAVSEDEYDAEADVAGPPEYVEIDGVRYVKTSDAVESNDVRDA